MNKIDQPVALITGSSQGIGLAVARLFAKKGYAVALADVQYQKVEAEAEALTQVGYTAMAVRCDVADERQVQQMIDQVYRTYGRLDAVVNDAGVHQTPHIDLADMPAAQYEQITSVNIRGTWACMKHEVPAMEQGGAIVNISSIGGLVGAAGESVYIATKHAILGLTKSAAKEYAPKGIRINAVCPGTIETPMARKLLNCTPGMEQRTLDTVPLGRLGRPEEIAEAVYWLASPQASYVVGHALVVDGGFLA